MPKKQQQLALLGVLVVVVMVAVYARMILRPAVPVRAPSVAPSADHAVPAAGPTVLPAGDISLDLSEDVGLRQAQRARATELAWGRDPFTGGSAGSEVGGFDLSGILWDAAAPIAVINGQMLRVGDEVEGYRIVTITQDRVTLSDGGQSLNLFIAQ